MGFIKNLFNRRKKNVQALEAGKENIIGTQQWLQNMLNNLKEKIKKIRYAVPEKYKEFNERIAKIEEELIEYDDSKNNLEEKRKIIEHIIALEFEFNDYLRNGEKKKEIELKVIPESKETTSGNEAMKAHRIELYESICETIKSKDELDEEAIKNVIEAWKKEKFTYSQPEREYVDKIIAEVVIDYQIKYTEKNGKLDKGIAQKLDEEVYNSIIAEYLQKTIEDIPFGDFNRLKLETMVSSASDEEIAENEETWRTILKYKCGMSEEKINSILSQPETEKPQEKVDKKPQQLQENSRVEEIETPKLTFLTKEQCFKKEDKLDILKKIGTKAAITDFAILLGGYASDENNVDIDSDSSLEGRTGVYWTKSDDGRNNARVVSSDGDIECRNVNIRKCGVRPALMLSSIDRIPTNGESGKKTRNEMLEVEYGYYPQKAVSKNTEMVLEQEFKNNRLNETGNIYTIDSANLNDTFKSFSPRQHKEYELNGNRYVRIKAKSFYGQCILSNGKKYEDGDVAWVEVKPIKWLVDEKAKMMITEKIIFAGVQFNREVNYKTKNFENTDINNFMVVCFAPEIIQILKEQQLANVNNKSTEDEGR